MQTIESCRVVTLDGSGRVAVETRALPELEPDRVLVAVKSCLVSPGTELAGVAARRAAPRQDGPAPFGYGNAGEVLQAGPGCTGIAPGLRVCCMGSGYALHASHVVVPRNLVVPVPEGLSCDEAAFGHLAATALWAVRRARLEFGQHLLVLGLGLVGQLAAQLARCCGAHLLVADRLPFRVRTALRCGAEAGCTGADGDLPAAAKSFTRGRGLDAAILAFGGDASQALTSVCRLMKTAPDGHQYGRIVIVGGARFEARFPVEFGNLDICASSRPGPGYHDPAWEHGQDYPQVLVPWTTRRNLEECLDAAVRKRLDCASLITHRLPLEEAPQGCEELLRHPDQALGVILNP